MTGPMAAAALQSALDPAAREAAHIDKLWWLYLWVLTAVFLLVAIWIFVAIRDTSRRRDPDSAPVIGLPEPAVQTRATRLVTSCVVMTIVILFVLLFVDFLTGNAIYAKPDPNAMAIRVTGHQWWWEVTYENPNPSEIVTTANELHVPVGKTVKFDLQSTDVIHSFWVPNMHGKKDLVPGIPTSTWFTATRPGEFRGQCAEYCGEQHAHMRLVFVAEKEPDFSNWLSEQAKPAPEPTTDAQRHGRDIFVSQQCIMCHTIQGTGARAVLGPDLTHVGSRKFLGAGVIPNTRAKMLEWIKNSQHDKPGNRMPAIPLPDPDLEALVDYLQTLK